MIADCTLSIAGYQLTGSTPAGALDTVKVTWGRRDSVSQPSPSTASCRVLLPEDPTNYADMYSIGRTVEINSRVQVWKEGTARRLDLANATIEGTTIAAGRYAPPAWANRFLAVIPPASPTSTIGAWDEIPTASEGQTWNTAITLTLSETPSYVEIRPAYYQSPSAYPYLGDAIAHVTDAATITLAAPFTPPPRLSGYWVGLAVIAQPVGKSWITEEVAWNQESAAWNALNTIAIANASITAPAKADSIDVNVFTGTITDTSISLDTSLNRPVMNITASDILADLSHRRIGSDPWPTHTLSQRVAAVIRELGTPVRTEIDPAPAARTLAWKDVDSQPAASILSAAATSTSSLLWASSHRTTGPYLKFEDPARRLALGRLTFDGSKVKITSSTPAAQISASCIPRAGVTVDRDNADSATIARLTWKEPGVNEKGERILTERTISVKDDDAIARIGYRDISISTELINRSDAEAALSAFYRSHLPGSYTLPNLTIDTAIRSERIDRQTLAAMLDATRRMGLAIRITDLPRWMAVPSTLTAYLDGGTYTYSKRRWAIQMALTRPESIGAGLAWNQAPAGLAWNQAAPLTWAITSSLTA